MLTRTTLITLPVLALLAGGCATHPQPKGSGDQAQRTAAEAKEMATDAKSAAERAAEAANEKADRMYKKAMSK